MIQERRGWSKWRYRQEKFFVDFVCMYMWKESNGLVTGGGSETEFLTDKEIAACVHADGNNQRKRIHVDDSG